MTGASSSARAIPGLREARALLASRATLDLGPLNVAAAELASSAQCLRAELSKTSDAERMSELLADLSCVVRVRDDLRERCAALRFDVIARVHAGLARLRSCSTVAELLPAAAAELAHCAEFDRTLVSSVRGTSWRGEALWLTPTHDPELADRIRAFVQGRWIPLGEGVLETVLIRRRVPVLVRIGADLGSRAQEGLMIVAGCEAYVAAPVIVDRRVVGMVQADCLPGGRSLTTMDRDNVATFAEGLGLVFERTALLERMSGQRYRAQEGFRGVERQLAGHDDAETVLIRRERHVAVVRTAAGLGKAAASALDRLLTDRERQVVELMVGGAGNRAIAEELVVTEETVKSHVRSVSRKLRASSRADIVSRYLRMRLQEGS